MELLLCLFAVYLIERVLMALGVEYRFSMSDQNNLIKFCSFELEFRKRHKNSSSFCEHLCSLRVSNVIIIMSLKLQVNRFNCNYTKYIFGHLKYINLNRDKYLNLLKI